MKLSDISANTALSSNVSRVSSIGEDCQTIGLAARKLQFGHSQGGTQLQGQLGQLSSKKLDWQVTIPQATAVQKQLKSGVVHKVARHICQHLKPKGMSSCDKSRADRVFNVLTSLPFIAIGLHTMRKRQSPEGKIWGASIIGVGCASTVFHTTSHDCKRLCRKLDYWSIALSTTLLTRVVRPGTPVGLSLTTAGLIPFQPFKVSAGNVAFVEADFAMNAIAHPDLRPAHVVHACSGAAGVGCFAAEIARPKMKYVHGMWHLLSATSLATTNALLAKYEEKREQGCGAGWPQSLWGFWAQKVAPKQECSSDGSSVDGSWKIQSV